MKKTIALILAFALILLALAGCNKSPTPAPSVPDGSGEQQQQQPDTPPDEPDTDGDTQTEDPSLFNIGVADGAAALGAAGLDGAVYGLLSESEEDIASMLADGRLDAAIVPASTAVRIYNGAVGSVQMAAIITACDLLLVENGDSVASVYDLADKTVYAADYPSGAQLIFEYIVTEYGFVIGDTLRIEYVEPSELVDKMASGEAAIGLMSAADAARASAGARTALSVSDEWENVTGSELLPGSCVIVAQGSDSEAVAQFLTDLRASVESVSDNVSAAVELGYAASADEAMAILGSCSFIWLDGADDMREALAPYIETMYRLEPDTVGGIPDDGFYR